MSWTLWRRSQRATSAMLQVVRQDDYEQQQQNVRQRCRSPTSHEEEQELHFHQYRTSERTALHIRGRTQALMSTNKPSAKLRTAARLAQSCKEWGDCLLQQHPAMETARSRP